MAAPSEVGYRELHPLSPEEAAWIGRLQDKLWEKRHDPNARPYCQNYWIEREGRILTDDERSRLETLILAHGLPCVMGAGVFGFGLSLTVYDHAPMPDTPPDGLLSVTNKHFKDCGNFYDRHETAWQAFSPLTHTPENERVCSFYGLERPRERSHYDY